MESYVWERRKITIQDVQNEVKRKYRVIKQTVAMHYSLHDQYRFGAKLSEIILLSASVIFLSTTFLDVKYIEILGWDPDVSKLILGVTSIFSFMFSLILMLLKWSEKSALHKSSAEKWCQLLNEFRDTKLEDGTWKESDISILNEKYAIVSSNTLAIPDRRFNKLKADYFSKVEVSKLISKYPGSPYFILWCIVKFKGICNAVSQNED